MAKKKKEQVTHLESSDMYEINLHHEKEKLRKKDLEFINLQMKFILIQIDNMKKELEIKRLEKERTELRISKERLKHKEFYSTLLEKYNVKEGFGFNPDTGEIK